MVALTIVHLLATAFVAPPAGPMRYASARAASTSVAPTMVYGPATPAWRAREIGHAASTSTINNNYLQSQYSPYNNDRFYDERSYNGRYMGSREDFPCYEDRYDNGRYMGSPYYNDREYDDRDMRSRRSRSYDDRYYDDRYMGPRNGPYNDDRYYDDRYMRSRNSRYYDDRYYDDRYMRSRYTRYDD